MKNPFRKSRLSLTLFVSGIALSLLTVSCGNDDQGSGNGYIPTAAAFNALRENALASRTQTFEFEADGSNVNLVSAKGVNISFYSGSFTLNGNPVTGTVQLKFIELFSGGDMAVTNKTTRGIDSAGNLAMLVSGGEFFVNFYKNGTRLDNFGGVMLTVPANLSGGVQEGMTLWKAQDQDTIAAADVVWDEVENTDVEPQEGVGFDDAYYYAYFNTFGWTNVDIYYFFTGPKTTLLADVPSGYNPGNSAIYLSYDGEGNSLAILDTYTAEGYFSEHYGQIPVGLACHLIFLTEENGVYRYAIKPVTITEGGIITFSMDETVTGTEAQLIQAIQAVQN